MLRRLYLLFPDREHAQAAVEDLEALQVTREHVHALAREGIDLGDLPPATLAQRSDRLRWLEQVLWYGNLAVFLLLLGFVLLMVLQGHWLAAGIGLALMLASYLAGDWFATRVIGVHASEFEDALRHGEVLLLVDVPQSRVLEIERHIERHHPEAVIGGTGWTIEALGM